MTQLHNNTHTILGTIIVVLLSFQPIIGLIHHRKFYRLKKRTAWSYAHIWYGRVLIVLGIINGGLGLQLAGNSKTGMIVYATVAGLVGAVYCAAVLVSFVKVF
jgi:hypothetical protein